MTSLNEYMNDGAHPQAQATLAFLRNSVIEESWCNEKERYLADVLVARWENCREQGYVVILRNQQRKQLNIAFFEHRNSDSLCAIKWPQNTLNSPTIDTAEFGDHCYSDKFDVSHQVDPHQAKEMAEWIESQFADFWIAGMECTDQSEKE